MTLRVLSVLAMILSLVCAVTEDRILSVFRPTEACDDRYNSQVSYLR